MLGAQLHYSNSCVTTCLLGAKRSRLESWPDATQSDRKKVEQTIAWAGLTSKLEANDRALGKGDIFGCHIGAGRSASTVPPPPSPRSRSVFFFFPALLCSTTYNVELRVWALKLQYLDLRMTKSSTHMDREMSSPSSSKIGSRDIRRKKLGSSVPSPRRRHRRRG